jgi:hypothetical protein
MTFGDFLISEETEKNRICRKGWKKKKIKRGGKVNKLYYFLGISNNLKNF